MAFTTSSTVVRLLCLAIVAMVVAHNGPVAEAVTCGQVAGKMAPCLNYLKSAGGPVPDSCCAGIRELNSAAKTTADRQTVCNCLKTTAGTVKGLNPDLAAGLPGKCGVSVPYKISPSTDCSSVK